MSEEIGEPGSSQNQAAQNINAWNAKVAKANKSPYAPPDPAWIAQYNDWLAKATTTMANPGCDDAYFKAHQGDANDNPITKIIPLGEYSLDRNQVLAPDFWGYIAMMGSINAFFFLGFPPWTLLFSGIEGKRGVLPNGTKVWNITFKFHFNPNSWNHIFRPEKGQWEVVASNQMSPQTYWTLNTVAKAQPKQLTQTVTPLHGWLYRPLDFAPVLLFS